MPGRTIRNTFWALGDYASYPLFMFFVIPALVYSLGVEEFGLWVFAMAASSMAGIASLGMPGAVVRLISLNRGRDEKASHADILQTAFAVSLGTTTLFVGCFIAAAIGAHAYSIGWLSQILPPHVVLFVLVTSLMQDIDSVAAAGLRGMERWDVTSRLEILSRVVLFGGAIVIGLALNSLPFVLAWTALVTLLRTVLRVRLLSRVLGTHSFDLRPSFHRAIAKQALAFGIWHWLNNLGALLLHSADKALIASLMGPAALARYAACTQLAQQVHAVPAAGLSVLFPAISRLSSNTTQDKEIRRLVVKSHLIGLAGSTTLALLLDQFGQDFLSIWISAEFALSNGELLSGLTYAYLALSITAASHFVLLGFGASRVVALTNALGGVLSIAAVAILTPTLQLDAAVVSRWLYALCLFMNFGFLWMYIRR